MMYEYFIAKRYLKSKRRGGFISFPTLFPFIVIVLSVASITIFLSIMNGFESVVIDRFLMLDSHVQVIPKGSMEIDNPEQVRNILDSIPEVASYAPFVSGKVMLFADLSTPVTLKGIDLSKTHAVSNFLSTIVMGTDDFTSLDSASTRPGVIIGDGVWKTLKVIPGDRIRIMSFSSIGGFFREPDITMFEVTGIFKTEIAEYDYLNTYTSLEEAQRFFGMGESVSGFDVNAHTRAGTAALAEAIKRSVPDGLLVKTWYDQHKNLYSSMKLEKIAAIAILSLIILVATFSTASSLIMLVLEKRREIGILISMGSTEKGVRKIFLIIGLIIGVTGTLLGLITGFLISWLQIRYEFFLLPPGLYIISALPIKMKILDFAVVGMITLILTYFATIYPARKASLLKPAQALRYE